MLSIATFLLLLALVLLFENIISEILAFKNAPNQ